jgi:ribosomal protein L30E
MNIWEIVTLTDLIKILKENENKFVIVAITLESTPQNIIKSIKKFLKKYAKIYENLTFLYYQANIKDLGRSSLLVKNPDEYPFVYHVYNTKDIFVSVNRANETTIYEAFTAVEEYYKKDLQAFLLNKNENNTNNTNINNDNDKEDKSNIQINQTSMNANLEVDERQADMDRRALEHQKLLDKIVLFEEKKKDYNIKFLGDIQKRKKDEQKQ